MRNVLLTALLLTACTSEPPATEAETHEQLECGDSWLGHAGSRSFCEAPCESLGALGSHGQCTINGTACPAGKYIDWRENEGCCVNGAVDGAQGVLFVECD